ncbi:MAG: Amidohydrolase 3, partial [Deltaproteobacteria bacterium]|nr:Amidohydrolase 3 [Deltaproteobacteria bacterium]
MDLAILSTRIFTGNPKQPWAEALGIKGDRIAAVGTNADVKKGCRRKTQIMEMKGRLVTP